jgi:LacI family transcriptional regulator
MTECMVATIYDVAKRAGLSVGTVSRYLNGSTHVSERSRERVRAAIQELGFVPSNAARTLSRRRTGLIGFLVSDLGNPFTAELARAIQDRADHHGYCVLISNTDGEDDRTRRMLQVLREHQVDGLIASPPESPAISRGLLEARASGVEIVLLGMKLDPAVADRVVADTYEGAVAAVSHLIGLGHERIGFIGGKTARGLTLGRRQGYLDGLARRGLAADDRLMVETRLDREGGAGAMGHLLDLPDPPTAVSIANDAAALGAMQEAARRGLRVPKDLSVVGFDDIALAGHALPPLTTVAQPKQQLGEVAVDMLVARLRGEGGSELADRRLPCRLVIRESTAEPRRG